jgi:hypothetical protein
MDDHHRYALTDGGVRDPGVADDDGLTRDTHDGLPTRRDRDRSAAPGP